MSVSVSVKELEAQLKRAREDEALKIHELAMEKARSVDHHVSWINTFFLERVELEDMSTLDHYNWVMDNRLQGGRNDETNLFVLKIKDSPYRIIMEVGQKYGGWKPYKSHIYVVNNEEKNTNERKRLVQAVNKLDNDFCLPYRNMCGKDLKTEIDWRQFISALEIFICTYLKVSKKFPVTLFTDLFHLALIAEL